MKFDSALKIVCSLLLLSGGSNAQQRRSNSVRGVGAGTLNVDENPRSLNVKQVSFSFESIIHVAYESIS